MTPDRKTDLVDDAFERTLNRTRHLQIRHEELMRESYALIRRVNSKLLGETAQDD